eukprot:g13463.t1
MSSVAAHKRHAIGAHRSEAEDRTYGRWWKDYRDKRRPIFYSQIGQICRKPGIHKSLLYVWQKHTRNWCKIVKDLHRKRWPLHYGLTIGFFAEFCFARKWGEKNLFEVCAMLPGYGVGCKLWKPSYSGGGTAGGTQVFVPESIDFRLRPFKGKVVGSTLESLRKVIREAFGFFDKLGNATVTQEEVATIMRYLGQFPSEQDVVEVILREIQDDDPSNVVSYDAFEKMMLRCLMEREYDPDDSETLLAAFKVLDPDSKGYIEVDKMKEYLGSGAVGFREKEWSEFYEYAKDRDPNNTNRIYYEDYVAKLTTFVDKHIETLYADAKK